MQNTFRASIWCAIAFALVSCGNDSGGGTIDAGGGETCVNDSQCDDDNSCTIDSCQDDGTCKNAVNDEAIGEACDDGLACTEGETCSDTGACAGPAKDCTSLGDVCNDGVCTEAAGGCTLAPKVTGTTCDDGMFCTEADSCTAGVCGGTVRDCSAQDGACTVGTCDEVTAACIPAPVADTTVCDDGLFCTSGDTCTAGVCGGAVRDCTGAGNACNTGTCDEGSDACVATPANQGATCDDGLFCTTTDTCSAGTCGGVARDCASASNECNTGTCNEASDACVPQPANQGASCNDTLFCTTGDTCNAGTCGGAARDCSAFSNQCNLGTCNEGTDACVAQAANQGATCNDGLFCTTGEACSAGTCAGGGATACGDASTCTADTCNETTNVCDHVNTPVPGAEGPPGSPTCSDNLDNDCDGSTDVTDPNCAGCQSAGDCNDDNPCTADTCGAGGVCANAPSSGASCNDNAFCTVNDVCTAGVCGGAARNCSAAGNQCNDGTCNEGTDTCVATPKSNGTTCNDGAFCTNPDVCTAGVCGGSARDCSAQADACNNGACNEGTDLCVKAPKVNGTVCTDSLFCTVSESCQAGACTGATRDCSASANACNNGTCNEGTDACAPTPKPNGTTCDTLFCANGETCTAGTCGGGTPNTCSDGNTCTSDTCNEGSDTCSNPNRTVSLTSGVFSTSTDNTPQTACLVANSGARVMVWTELVDTVGQPIAGATVTIGGAAATASTTAPGSYYREIVAGAAGMQVVSVGVTACSSTVTLTQTVTITTVAANTGTGGTGGCAPSDGNLRVKVVTAETGAAIVGANVLIGPSQGTPFEHAPEGVLGGTSSFASNVATTDGSGFATFYDYGGTIGVPFTITAGTATRAYFTAMDVNASDVVLALPLLHAPAVPTTTYTNGTGPGTVTGCDDLDASIILPKLKLDFFSSFDINQLFEKNRCWASGNSIVNTVQIPENLWLPPQSIGPFCLGGAVAAAPWAISLENTASTGVTENLQVVAVSLPALEANTAISSGGISGLLALLTFRNVGWTMNHTVPTAPTDMRMVTAPENYPATLTLTYGNRPAETDVVGLTAGDYSGQNGTGSIFLLGSKVHKFGDSGSTVAVANSDLNDGNAPVGARRFASVAALYLDAAAHPNVPLNRIQGVTAVLIRAMANGSAPFAGTTASLTVSGMLGIAGTIASAATFTWENATLNGNTPLYSVHELSLRSNQNLPVLSCATTNQVREDLSVQWIVTRPFSASCAGSECFTLPTLPATFPRAATSTQKKSGFEQRLGSGATCTGAGQGNCITGETCVDSDGAGAAGLRCMTGAGTVASPYVVQDYFWKLHLYDLELAMAWTWNAFQFADRLLFMTHESSNEHVFQ